MLEGHHQNLGEEIFLLMLSPKPIGEIPIDQPIQESQRLAQLDQLKGAKDVLLVEEDSASAEPAGFHVAPVSRLDQGKMISLQIKVRHGR